MVCTRYSTICLSDENEIFIWGKNILEKDNSDNSILFEPTIICKVED